MAEDILFGLFEDYIKGTPVYVPVLLGVILIALGRWILKKEHHLPRYMVLVTVLEFILAEAAGVVCAVLPGSGGKKGIIFGLCLSAMILLLFYGVANYLWIERQLYLVRHFTDTLYIDCDNIKAWNIVASLSERRMTVRQNARCKKHKVFLLITLGNLSAAEPLIESMKEDGARYHFLMNLLRLRQGKTEQASVHARRAEEACTADTDPLIHVQILHNRAVSLIGQGHYRDADKAFKSTLQFVKERKIRDKRLLLTIYQNYAFNRIRIEGRDADWKAVIDELQAYLDMDHTIEYLALSNARLELMREAEEPAGHLNQMVNCGFDRILRDKKLPERNKLVLAASTARIVWASGLDPRPCIDYLSAVKEKLLELPMPVRYESMKQINIMFEGLCGCRSKEEAALREYVFWYRKNQAIPDLEEYLGSSKLPQVSVDSRIYLLMELAGLQKEHPQQYELKHFMDLMKDAAALCDENSLLPEGLHCRLSIMDELCGEQNLDRNFKAAHADIMREQLSWVEPRLDELMENPQIAEIYLMLGFYCFHLDDYDRCVLYYERVRKCMDSISLEHFAPWLHRYYMVVCFIARSRYFCRAVERIQRSKEIQTYEAPLRLWFERAFMEDGLMMSALLGRFMGAGETIPIKVKTWEEPAAGMEHSGTVLRRHFWLVVHPVGLEMDFTYQQFALEENPSHCYFALERHPMQTMESNVIKRSAAQTGRQPSEVLLLAFAPDGLPEQEKTFFDSVYNVIVSHVEEPCPKIQELERLFSRVILPRPVPYSENYPLIVNTFPDCF